jgi:hypothetical protein
MVCVEMSVVHYKVAINSDIGLFKCKFIRQACKSWKVKAILHRGKRLWTAGIDSRGGYFIHDFLIK